MCRAGGDTLWGHSMLSFFRFSARARVFLVLCTLLPAGLSAYAQGPSASSNASVSTTVTVLGPKFTPAPPVSKGDVSVYDGKTRLQVTNWISARANAAALQLAIMIDNSASELGVGSQLGDIASFIRSQSRNTAVGVFYAVNGTVQVASTFSTDHDAVAKTLRPPLGLAAGDSPSIYVSLSDLVKNRWKPSGARHEVLLISDGVDGLDPGPDSLYVHNAIEDVQKAGVVVHTVYTGSSIRFAETFRGQYAQSNLEELTSGSGGFGFYEGISPPVSYHPFLQQLNQVLQNQYVLTFSMPVREKKNGELRGIDVHIEQRNLEIKYPKQVFVPGQPAK